MSSFLLNEAVDVVIQMVAQDQTRDNDSASLSLSCNPDITLELLKARTEGEAHFSLWLSAESVIGGFLPD